MSIKKAWHIITGTTLRDGRPIPKDKEWLVNEGTLELCRNGFHASERLLDAMGYMGNNGTITRVAMGNPRIEGSDKMVAKRRKILWRLKSGDAVFIKAARVLADQVLPLWATEELVEMMELYEATKDEELFLFLSAELASDSFNSISDRATKAKHAYLLSRGIEARSSYQEVQSRASGNLAIFDRVSKLTAEVFHGDHRDTHISIKVERRKQYDLLEKVLIAEMEGN